MSVDDDDLPPPRKPRPLPKKPPRASWEPPDLDEEVAAPTERTPIVRDEPAVVSPPPIEPAPVEAPVAPQPVSPVTPLTDATYASGAHVDPALVADPIPAGAYPAGGASGGFAASDPSAPGGYPAPVGDPTGSGAYASGTYPAGAYAPYPSPPTSGPHDAPASSPLPDDPLAPLSSADDALRLAAGVKPRKRRAPTEPSDVELDDDDDQPRSRKLLVVALFALVLGLGIAALVVFGALNKNTYAIECEADQIVAAQGRGFPPWGTQSLDDGAMWKPIKIPPEAECLEDNTEDPGELSAWFLARLEDRANVLLQTRDVSKTDEAATLLEQALLHTRDPGRRDQRARIERLLGDVQYWHASAKLQQASTALSDAAKQFDAASAQRPRHVTDAAAWAAHVRKLVDDLKAGPSGAPTTVFPPLPPAQPDRPPAPPGVALPVEAPKDAGVDEAPPADAAVLPSGGVLL